LTRLVDHHQRPTAKARSVIRPGSTPGCEPRARTPSGPVVLGLTSALSQRGVGCRPKPRDAQLDEFLSLPGS
jgi:hypothetical protein